MERACLERLSPSRSSASAVDLVAKEFSGAQQGLIKVEVAGKPTYDDRTRTVNAALTIAIDQDAYRKFVRRVEQVLDQTAIEQVAIVGDGHLGSGNPRGLTYVAEVNALKFRWPGRDKPSPGLVVCDRLSNDLKSTKWKAYALAPEIVKAVRDVMEPLSISVDLLDEHGEAVDSCNLPLNKAIDHYPYISTPISLDGDWVMVAPVSGGHASLGIWANDAQRSRSIPLTFSLSPDQLRTVASIRCTVAGSRGSSSPDGATGKSGQSR